MSEPQMAANTERKQSPIEIQLAELANNIETLERRLECVREPGSLMADKPAEPPPPSNSPVYQRLNEANARLRNLRDTLQV